MTYLLLDQALGEYDVETRVGGIIVEAPSQSSPETISLEQLPKAFDDLFVHP
jgi:hypothetical protein